MSAPAAVRRERCMWLAHRSDGKRTPCCARSQWQICIDVRSSWQSPVFRVLSPLKVCGYHKKFMTLDAILEGGGWGYIRKTFRTQNRKEPRKRCSRLAFERIEQRPAPHDRRSTRSARRRRGFLDPTSPSAGNACKASRSVRRRRYR